MKKISLIFIVLQLVFIFHMQAQNRANVVYNYDADGNRISVNYILTKYDEDDILNDSVSDTIDYVTDDLDLNIEVYPNPTSGYLVLSSDLPGNMPKINVRLYSLQGNIIENIELTSNRTEFNISDYPAGVYFLSVIFENERHLWKIVKN